MPVDIERLQSGAVTQLTEVLQTFTFRRGNTGSPDFLADPRNYFLVAYDDHAPVGYLLGYELPRPEAPHPMFFLYDIEVTAAQRRRGIARRLIETFMAHARARQGSRILVLTEASNTPAVRLYTVTGARQLSEDGLIFVYELIPKP